MQRMIGDFGAALFDRTAFIIFGENVLSYNSLEKCRNFFTALFECVTVKTYAIKMMD